MSHLRVAAITAALAALLTLPAATGGGFATTSAQSNSTAWLYDPLQVNVIDLSVGSAALDSLWNVPRRYVDAEITLHDGTTTYGPYSVGLRLKGNNSFRNLDGKPAFRISFGHSVAKQRFLGLKGLTLNNMVQDPSMIAEAMSSVLLTAIGLPSSRVGYAFVRLNGGDLGLYANVETIDKVWAQRWFASTRHIYEASYGADTVPGDGDGFNMSVGRKNDNSDLVALIDAASNGGDGWSEQMKPAADLAEFALAFAAEHYMGQWDGYSYGSDQNQPNNYDLASDDAGRFSMIITGTDQTWLDKENFAVTGNGLLFRACVVDPGCQPLYIAALRQIAANKTVASLADTARAVKAAIAPWRARDPRREQSVAEGAAQADDEIAFMRARPAQLDAWFGIASSAGPAGLAPARSVRPLLGNPSAVPAASVAGKRFAFSLPVTRSDTGAPLAAGKLAATVWVRRREVNHVDSFANGRARVSLMIPKASKGGSLRIKVTVTAAGQTALAIYTYPIR